MGSSPERKGRGKEEGERGRGLGCSWGTMGGAAMEEGSRPFICSCVLPLSAFRCIR
jgi:hypothetical protein